jgi:F-type H+-transporting ATPase subunit b
LVKWGFPAITSMIDKRKEFIDKSLQSAKEANARLADIQKECDKLLVEAHMESDRIIKETYGSRNKILADAKNYAEYEGQKMIEEAKIRIDHERNEAIRNIRLQVAELSVSIAEKVIRKKLENKEEQYKIIDHLIDDVNLKN